jgi:hypothetical protein
MAAKKAAKEGNVGPRPASVGTAAELPF